MEEKLKNIISSVFDVPVDSIDDSTSPDSITNWNSLKHMDLVVAIEEEFEIELDNDEISDMMNYPLVKSIINEKLS